MSVRVRSVDLGTFMNPWVLAAGSLITGTGAFGALATSILDLNSKGVVDSAGTVWIRPQMATSLMLFRFFGTGVDNDLGDCRISLYRPVTRKKPGPAKTQPTLLTPTYAGEVRFTLGARTGIANGLGGDVGASARYADTISITLDHRQNSLMRVFGPAAANEMPAELAVDLMGASLVRLDLRCESPTTGVNAMWSGVNSG